jgi:actin-related protein
MLLQIMFETFSVPAVCVCSRPLLCLQASHRSTGVVVQCDSSESSIYAIVDGHVVPHASSRACFHSGNDLTNHMITLLQRRGVEVRSQPQPWADVATRTRVGGLRDALCCVALDYDLEVQTVAEQSHVVEGLGGAAAAVCIRSERLECPEILFRPLLPGVASMHSATHAAIAACDCGVQHRLYASIVLAGSALRLPGMQARMEKEMRCLAPGVRVSVSVAAEHSVWAGGAMLANSPSFLHSCVTKACYDEYGPAVVHSKFPAGGSAS